MRRVEWLGDVQPGDSVAAVWGIDKLSPSDLAALKRTADELGVPVDSLAAVMSIEGGFNPQARNPHTRATGIIQFIPSTARSLGTTVDELFEMTFQEQLPYVVKFYEMNRCTGVQDPGELYTCTFCPALRGKPEDFVVGEEGVTDVVSPCATRASMDKVYNQNKSLDVNKDGVLTAGDVRDKARRRLDEATGRIPIGDVPPEGPPKKKKKASPLPVILGGAALVALGVWTGVL